MVSSWVLSRFRTAWLTQNLTLLVLTLLRESTLSEWEILARLHSRYGLNPSGREFGRLEKELVGEGFVVVEPGIGGDRLRITTAGTGVLARLQREYNSLVSNAVRP